MQGFREFSLTALTRTSTITKIVSEYGDLHRKVRLFLEPVVRVDRVRNISLDLTSSLGYIGSNMGLYLGLGVLQFIEMLCSRINAWK